MKNKIIDAQFFITKISNKTIWLFVLLINIDKIEGWGEATLQGKEKDIFQIKDVIFKKILNKNYTSPSDLKNILPFNNIVNASLSSAIMQCLWDIQGKIQKKTIGDIFGKKRESVEIYANFNRSTTDRSIAGIEVKSKEVLKDGFNYIKFAPFDEVLPNMTNQEKLFFMRKGLDRISVIRDVFGLKTKIMIDCHWRFNYETSIQLLKECKKFNLYWLECPIPEKTADLILIKKIRSKANSYGVKLAGLETKILKEGFYDYIKAEVYDVIMPDIKYAGGPDEMLEIEKTLNKFRIDFSPHNPSGPISHLHTMQICASTEKESLMEYQYKESPLFNSLMHRSIPEINQGKSLIPNFNYGLGMSLNKKQLASLS